MVAMAAGTFIYVGATEVIAEEFESPHDKWKKFSALSGMVFVLAACCNAFLLFLFLFSPQVVLRRYTGDCIRCRGNWTPFFARRYFVSLFDAES